MKGEIHMSKGKKKVKQTSFLVNFLNGKGVS